MKTPENEIREFNISELSVAAGRSRPTLDYHVVLSHEAPLSEKLWRPSRSYHFSIVLIRAGTCRVQSNLLQYGLEKNSLFIIPPGTIRQFLEKSDDLSVIIMEFTREFLGSAELHKKNAEAFTFFSSQSDPHLALSAKDAETLYRLMHLLWERDFTLSEHPFRMEVIHHAFNLFMYEVSGLFKTNRNSDIVKMTRKEELLMGFVKALSEHFKEERSVQYYADLLFVTPKHLTKTLKEITDKTSGELIDEMVISEAKILLDDVGMSVGNVADTLHFSDQFFFSKFFKNHTGMSPSEYKSSMP